MTYGSLLYLAKGIFLDKLDLVLLDTRKQYSNASLKSQLFEGTSPMSTVQNLVSTYYYKYNNMEMTAKEQLPGAYKQSVKTKNAKSPYKREKILFWSIFQLRKLYFTPQILYLGRCHF